MLNREIEELFFLGLFSGEVWDMEKLWAWAEVANWP